MVRSGVRFDYNININTDNKKLEFILFIKHLSPHFIFIMLMKSYDR